MAWHDSSWDYRMSVTVEAAQVAADLTDFPVYIDLSKIDAEHGFWSFVDTAGDDIRITTSDGETEVPVEVVDIDTSAKTGQVYFKGDVDSDDDTQFWLYYGNSSATAPAVTATYGRNNVWTSYDAVYHLEENTGTVVDSTGNNDGTGSGDSPTSATGKIGDANYFDGSDQIDANSGMTNTSQTVTIWCNRDSSAGGYDTSVAGDSSWRFQHTTSSSKVQIEMRGAGTGNVQSSTSWTTETWEHWGFSRSGTSIKIYYNGTVDNTGTITPDTSYTGIRIGSNSSTIGGSDPWLGELDELRMYDGVASDDYVAAEYANTNDPASFLTFGEQETEDGKTWYDTAWSHRFKLAIDPTKVGDTCSDFPVYIDLDDVDTGDDFWTTVDSAGADIRVTLVDGHTEIPIEIVDIDTSGKTGQMYCKADLSDGAETVLYVYFGNGTATAHGNTDTYGRNNVWTNYDAVYHLEENTGTVVDSTGTNDGTGVGDSPTSATGQIDNANTFDGSDYINANSGATNDSITVTMWANRDSTAGGYDTSISADGSWRFQHTTDGSRVILGIRETGETTEYVKSVSTWSTETWQHWGFRNDNSNVTIFYNGTNDYEESVIPNTSFNNIRIGGNISDIGGGDEWDGELDELRIYDGAASDGYVETEYNNTNSPSTFYTISASEALADDTGWFDTNWDHRVKVTVNSGHVAEDMIDFPVYFNPADLGTSHNFWTDVDSNGADIRVTQADGTSELPFEIVDLDTTGKTGQIHFLAPLLRSADDTSFYIYYGNTGASAYADNATYGAEKVWVDYEVVYHLNETSGSTAYDSAGNIDSSYTAGSTNHVSSWMGNGQDFAGDGTDDVDGASLPTDTKSELTVSVYVDGDTDYSSGNNEIYEGGGAQIEWGTFGWIRARHEDVSDGFFGLGSDSLISSTTDGKLIHVTYDGAIKQGYVDGTADASEAATGDITPGSFNLNRIGNDFPGVIAEVRVTNRALSANWVSAEYQNQSDSASFYTIGAEEDSGAGPAGPTFVPKVTFIN